MSSVPSTRSLLAAGLLLVAAGGASGYFARQAWNSVLDYQPPYAFVEGREAGPPIAERVVLAVIDGLRLDASRRMPRLNRLREQGADLECAAAAPSFSRPGRAALVTGAWASLHGATTNFHEQALGIDSLFRRASAGGRSCAVAGSDIYTSLFGADLGCAGDALLISTSEDPPGLYRQAEPGMKAFSRQGVDLMVARRPALGVLDFLATDYSSHDFGARSEDYRRTSLWVDEMIGGLVERLDLATTAVVLTSDHGHVDEGGHGGVEPEVLKIPLIMVGKGIKRGARGSSRQVDVAPTVAALLGLPIPAASQGRVLTEALDLTDEQRLGVLEAQWRQKAAFARAYAAALGGSSNHEPSGPAREAAALSRAIEGAEARVVRAAKDRLAVEARGRLPVFLAALVPALAALILGLRKTSGREWVALLAALIVYWAVVQLLLRARGVRVSMSAINHEEDLGPYFVRIGLFAALAAVAALAVAFSVAARSVSGFPGLCRLGLSAVAVLACALAVGVARFYLSHGMLWRWHLPEFASAFQALVDLVQLQAVCYVAVVVPALAWAVTREKRRWSKLGPASSETS